MSKKEKLLHKKADIIARLSGGDCTHIKRCGNCALVSISCERGDLIASVKNINYPAPFKTVASTRILINKVADAFYGN